jgi:8-oxo-dGTP pyrophosphatase MutT (NUDIX family)
MLHRGRKAAQPRPLSCEIQGRTPKKGVNMAASMQRPSALKFQHGALAASLAARLPQTPPQSGGHADDHIDFETAPREAIRAAVLIPVIAAASDNQAGPALLFTRRTETLARHSGQVSFPGGRIEPNDATVVAAALRETAEETGIAPGQVTLAGYLSRYRTGTGFDIQPVVGVLAPGFTLAPDPAEVAAVFEVPLAFFADPASHVRSRREWNGRVRSFYSFTYDGHEIWGATAAIIVDLVTRLSVVETL